MRKLSIVLPLAVLFAALPAAAQLWQAMTLGTYASESAATSEIDGLSSGPEYQNAGLIPVPNRGIYSGQNDLMSWLVFREPPTGESQPCEADQSNASPPTESRAWSGHPNCVIVLDLAITTTQPTTYTLAKADRDGLSSFMRPYAALLPFPSAYAHVGLWYVAYRPERSLCVP